MTQIPDFILYLLKDFLICATYVFACIYLLGGKQKKNIAALITVPVLLIANAAFGVFFFNGTQEDRMLIMDSVSSICSLVCVIVFIKDIRIRKRVWFLLLCSFTMELFFSLFAPYLPTYLYAEALVYIAMYAIFLFVLLYNVRNTAVNFMPQVFDEMPKWIFVAVLIFDLTGYYKSFGESYEWYNILYIASTIGVIICVLFFILKIFTLTYQQNEILRQFREQKDYSEKMLKNDESLRKFRHDYRNHMIAINAYLEDGNTEKAREYLNSLNAGISDTLNKISTGNFVADAIINNKAVAAAQYGDTIVFDGQFPHTGISDEDLCTILANALDNAIEAAQKCNGQSVISVEAAIRNKMFILSICNPVVENIKIGKNNTIKTTKRNKTDHGIGTKNIQKVVTKYNGALTLDCTDHIFTFAVRLNLPTPDA